MKWFTESEFRGIGGCLRGVNNIPKRMYLTCNPGGVGHQWVKRLFIDKKYRENENPDDYCFIPAKWSDNKDLMEFSPAYRNMLDNLPENIRPFAIVTMGYPAETPKQPEGRYKPEKIHWGCWENTDAPVETAAE